MIRPPCRPLATVALLSLASLAAGGCESAMHQENVDLHRQNRELQDKLDAANAQLRDSPDPAQFKMLQAELLDRDRQITDLRNQPPPAAATAPAVATGPAPSPFGDLETSVDARAGTVTVSLPGDVLFPSGQADLRASARASLDKVVSALKKTYPGRPIRVEGHTDADPIVKSSQEWDDNLDLSLARAAAVSRYLEAHGVDPKKVTTSGFGQFRPRGSSKPRNRRVEIVVVMR
jgi:flagellar motor protein MotB